MALTSPRDGVLPPHVLRGVVQFAYLMRLTGRNCVTRPLGRVLHDGRYKLNVLRTDTVTLM